MVFGGVGLAFLLAGLVIAARAPATAGVLFPAYATSVVATVTLVIAGNVGEHVVSRKKEDVP